MAASLREAFYKAQFKPAQNAAMKKIVKQGRELGRKAEEEALKAEEEARRKRLEDWRKQTEENERTKRDAREKKLREKKAREGKRRAMDKARERQVLILLKTEAACKTRAKWDKLWEDQRQEALRNRAIDAAWELASK